MRPKELDSIHKRHLGTDKWYQFRIKGLELILGLSLSLSLGGQIMGTDPPQQIRLSNCLDLETGRDDLETVHHKAVALEKKDSFAKILCSLQNVRTVFPFYVISFFCVVLKNDSTRGNSLKFFVDEIIPTKKSVMNSYFGSNWQYFQ